MARRYGIIEGGQVSRVFVATPEALASMIAAERKKLAELEAAIDVTDLMDVEGTRVSKGHLYDAEAGDFRAPPEPEEPAPTPSAEERLAELERELAKLKEGGGRG